MNTMAADISHWIQSTLKYISIKVSFVFGFRGRETERGACVHAFDSFSREFNLVIAHFDADTYTLNAQ